MMFFNRTAAACVALLLLTAGAAAAHHCRHQHHAYRCADGDCWGRSDAAPASRETLEGTVEEVIYLPGAALGSGMVEVRLSTANGSVTARLAPSGILKRNGMEIREGDTLSVTGYRPDTGLLVATSVTRQGRTVALRDRQGRSAW